MKLDSGTVIICGIVAVILMSITYQNGYDEGKNEINDNVIQVDNLKSCISELKADVLKRRTTMVEIQTNVLSPVTDGYSPSYADMRIAIDNAYNQLSDGSWRTLYDYCD